MSKQQRQNQITQVPEPEPNWLEKGRIKQKRRTRKELLQAAATLMKQGIAPTVAEAAKLADVSRATAYRYFPNQEALLTEAPLDIGIPRPEDIFGRGEMKPREAEDRVALLERTVHDITFRDMAKIRMFLRTSMDRHLAGGNSDPTVPLRQGRRMELIEAALLPLKTELSAKSHKTLSSALAIVIGIEAMIALTDVVQLKPAEARQVKNWAVRALVRAARLDSAKAGSTAAPPPAQFARAKKNQLRP